MTSEAAKSVVESASQGSGGILCFAASGSSSSRGSSESAMHGAHGEYYYIRIPGPQVIGYFLQMVPEDKTAIYTPLLSKDGKNEVLEALKLFNSAPDAIQEPSEELEELDRSFNKRSFFSSTRGIEPMVLEEKKETENCKE